MRSTTPHGQNLDLSANSQRLLLDAQWLGNHQDESPISQERRKTNTKKNTSTPIAEIFGSFIILRNGEWTVYNSQWTPKFQFQFPVFNSPTPKTHLNLPKKTVAFLSVATAKFLPVNSRLFVGVFVFLHFGKELIFLGLIQGEVATWRPKKRSHGWWFNQKSKGCKPTIWGREGKVVDSSTLFTDG